MSNSPIYVAKALAYGPHRKLISFLAQAKLRGVVRRDGSYAIIGNRLLHLCGWTTCDITAQGVAQANRENPDDVPGEVVLLGSWPHDVSGWQQVGLSDAPSPLHMPSEAVEELSRHGR